METKSVCAFLVLAVLPACTAEETEPIFGVYNEASIAEAVRIAPGSNMLIFSGVFPIGPDVAATAPAVPPVTSLAGASVRVTVGDAAVDAYLLGAETNYIRAMLPAGTPPGEGRLVVTYNGRPSAPYLIQVVKRHFAIYDGSWCGRSSFPKQPSFCMPRSVRNARDGGASIENSLTEPARPGQLITLRGTGLGEDRSDVQVWVGGRQAEVVSSGPAECCAGTDEITFAVPAGVEGCKVPVWVQYDQSGWTGDVFVSVASGDGACSDPRGLTSSDVGRLVSGNLQAARVSIGGGSWYAAFGTAVSTSRMPSGVCQASSWSSNSAVDLSPAFGNVGRTLTLQTPSGRLSGARTESGIYMGTVDGAAGPGDYTLDNNGGDASALPFRAQFSLPAANPVWNNRDTFPEAPLDEGATVTWTGLDAAGYQVVMSGAFANDGEISGGFICQEAADKGTFTIPAGVLRRAGLGNPHLNELSITVSARFTQRSSIDGFDFTEFTYVDSLGDKTVALGGAQSRLLQK
jgi:uncharacterized protein (TIGR03437 family)